MTRKMILIVGGIPEHVRRIIIPALNASGLSVFGHWEKEDRKRLPLSVDLILLIATACSRETKKHIRDQARQESIPVVIASHQWTRVHDALVANKIIPAQPVLHPPIVLQELPVSEKSPLPSMKVTPVPSEADNRARKLRELVRDMFDIDGFKSIMVTRSGTEIVIDAEQIQILPRKL